MGYATKSYIAGAFRATCNGGGLKGLLMHARGGGWGGELKATYRGAGERVGHAEEGGGAIITLTS